MKIESGMVAYISGAGSGIGRGMALALARRGVKIAACDIRLADAEATASAIERDGGKALAMELDVSDAEAVDRAADEIERTLGPVGIVCNNAGVAMHGVALHEIPPADWDWVMSVNIGGVINGIRAFVPRLLASGKPGHIVNTASISGFQVNPDFLTGAYSMTKFAVVALSEALQQELSQSQVQISVLAPAAVATGIHLSERSRPERMGGAYVRPQNHFMGDLIKDGADPAAVGEQVAAAIEANQFYIFTHAETLKWLDARHQRIRDAFASLEGERGGMATH